MRNDSKVDPNRKGWPWLTGLALALPLVLASVLAGGSVNGAFAQEPVVMGVNVQGDGSIPRAPGPSEVCLEVSVGEVFDVDIYVTDVVELFSWELPFIYDPSVLEVTLHDVVRFLAFNPGSAVINASEPTPDRDGLLFLGAADIGDRPETGSGVLARLTLRARNPGVSPAKVGLIDFNDDGRTDLGPRLTSASGEAIGDQLGDGFVDRDSLFEGKIAVGVDCSTAATEPPPSGETPPSGEAPPSGETPVEVTLTEDGALGLTELVEQVLADAPPPSISDSQPPPPAALGGGVREPDDTSSEAGSSAGPSGEEPPSGDGSADGQGSEPPGDTSRGDLGSDGGGGFWLIDPLWLIAIFAAATLVGGALAITLIVSNRSGRWPN